MPEGLLKKGSPQYIESHHHGPLSFWLGDQPSEFETAIANQIKDLESDNKLYFVRLYPVQNKDIPVQEIINNYLPTKAEFPTNRCVSFFHIENEMKVKLPVPRLNYINDPNCIGNIHISSEEYVFSNQTLLLLACSQKEQDVKNTALASTYDVFGYLTLMLGGNIFKKEIFSKYFCLSKKKFVSKEFELKNKNFAQDHIIGLKKFYEFENFNAEDDKIHAALWFSGRAYSANDNASKIVFYKTALELAAAQQYQNWYGKIYKGRIFEQAQEKLNSLKIMRDQLLHKGKAVSFPDHLERYIQIFILDAIAYKQGNSLKKTGFEYLCELENTLIKPN